MNTIIIIHTIQAFLLGLMLLTRRFRSLPNLFLMVILFGIVLFDGLHYLVLNNLISDQIRLLFSVCFILPPPLILSYWYTYIYGKIPSKQAFITHLLLPFFLFILSTVVVITGTSTKIALIITGNITALFHLVYPFFMLRVLQSFYKIDKKRILTTLKFNSEKTSILKVFGFMMLLHGFIFLFQYNTSLLFPEKHLLNTYTQIQIFFLIILQYLIIWVIINMPVVIHFSDKKIGLSAFKKYKHSSLTHDEASNIANILNCYMQSAKPYLNPLYSMLDLSRDVEINNLHVTETLNGLIGQSYNDYINNYRVEEVKRLIREPDHSKTSILAITFESGFNSKATFYVAFKKFTGITPTTFRNQYSPDK